MTTIRCFARVPEWVRTLTRLTNNAFRVLITLCRFLDDEGRCWKSLKTIATETHLDQSNVVRALTRLELLRVISRVPQSDGGRRKSTIYRVNFDPPLQIRETQNGFGSGDSTTVDSGGAATVLGGAVTNGTVVASPLSGGGEATTQIKENLTRSRRRPFLSLVSKGRSVGATQAVPRAPKPPPSDPGARFATAIVRHPTSPSLTRTAALISRVFDLMAPEAANERVSEILRSDESPISPLMDLIQRLEPAKNEGASPSLGPKPIK
jgi:hypothetical protein